MKHLSLKFVLFSALFFAPVVISGCWFCNCKDIPVPPETYYDTQGVDGIVNFTNGGSISQPHFANEVFLRLSGFMRYYTSLPCLPKQKGGASLLACSCNEYKNDGKKGTTEYVRKISIVSNANYKTGYESGVDLVPLMRITTMYPHLATTQEKMKLSDFLQTNPQAPKTFFLFFDASPQNSLKHIFTIRYELDNGEVYNYTTPEITFQ